jgi:hypothetical protein
VAIDRRAGPLLVAVLAALMAMTVFLADRKPLWNDELFTYYISRLPGVGDMWSTLATGVEQTPISFYVVTRACLDVFGDGAVAMRVPEMLGYLLMCVCVFRFVVRRASPLYGLVAVLLPIATIAYGYAYEARAYGLVLGFSAAALLCWQVTTEAGSHRQLWALGTAVSLAAAVGSHYYAVLLVIPLLVGEAVRSRARRRVDWLVLGSFSGALAPLVLFAPLIKEAQDYSTTFWSLPTWTSGVRFYPDALLDRALPVGIALVLSISAFAALRSSSLRAGGAASLRRPPDHELAALLTLLLLPLFAVALGKLATGAFTERSALPALLAVTILIAFAASWLDGGVPIAGLLLLLLFTVFAGARLAERYGEAAADAREQTEALRFLQRHRGDGPPIAIASPHDFFELSHRAAKDGGPPLIYLVDPALALKYLGTDAVEFGVVGMHDIAPLHVEQYRSFIASHSHFLVYGRHRAWDWLTSALQARGARARVYARNPENGAELLSVRLRG